MFIYIFELSFSYYHIIIEKNVNTFKNFFDKESLDSKLLEYFSTAAEYIYKKVKKLFPYLLPNRYLFELSVLFISKYSKLDEMYSTFKLYHKKMTHFTDAAVNESSL